jgi:transcriptional regulator with XRE-family HTH domain
MVKTLGQRVAEKRTLRGFTQKELAEAIRLQFPYFKGGQSTIQAIESGQSRNPTILFELARALNCSEQYLKLGVEGPGDKPSQQNSLGALEAEMEEILGQPQRPLPQRPLPRGPRGPVPPDVEQAQRAAAMAATSQLEKMAEEAGSPSAPQRTLPPQSLNSLPRGRTIQTKEPEQEEQASRVPPGLMRFAHAVLGSYEMLGLTKDESVELLEIISDAANGPLPELEGMDELQSRRMLAWNNTRRFLQAKHAKNQAG